MKLTISREVADKLADKHNTSRAEVAECFANRDGPYFLETDPTHVTDPPSYWFVAETDKRRVLKVVFVRYDDHFAIKSAYDPDDGSDEEYYELCRQHIKNQLEKK